MRINTLSVTNFKDIQQVDFKLNDKITVFAGGISTVNTNLLDALAIALESFFMGIPGIHAPGIQKSDVRREHLSPQYPAVIETRGEICGNKNVTWRRALNALGTTKKGLLSIRNIAHGMLQLSRTPVNERHENKDVLFPVIALYGKNRFSSMYQEPQYQRQIEGVKRAYEKVLSGDSSIKCFLDWFKTQDDSIKKFHRDLEIQHFNAVLSAFENIGFNESWKDLIFDHKTNALVGTYMNGNGVTSLLSYNELPNGFRHTFSLVADIAFRCIQLNPQLGVHALLEAPGVVLIDEIERHLPLHWQKNIINTLKAIFPNIQFIATTSSFSIIEYLSDSEIILL